MSRSFLLLTSLVIATAAVPIEPGPSGPDAPRETKDRIPLEQLAVLVDGPLQAAEKGDLPGAERAFGRLVEGARRRHGNASVGEVDLFTGFGVQLFERGSELDREDMRRLSPAYMAGAVEASKRAFGPRHPETALALHSYADVLVGLHSGEPPAEAEAALAESYSIRQAALGAGHSETLAAMRALARVKAARFRTAGKLDEAAELFRRAIAIAARSPPPESYLKAASLRLNLVRAYAEAGRTDDALREARIAAEEESRERTSRDDPCIFAHADAIAMVAELEEERPAAAQALRPVLVPPMACLEGLPLKEGAAIPD